VKARAADVHAAFSTMLPDLFRNRSNVDWESALFSVGGRRYTLRDVVRAAVLRGDWSHLQDQVRLGLACVNRARSGKPPAVDLTRAADGFRYERNLITVEETEAWLERFGVTFDEWTACLERSLLRRMWADEAADVVVRFTAGDDEVAACIYPEAICSGELARFADVLAVRAAVFDGAQTDRNEREPPDLARLEAAFQAYVRDAITPSALEAQIEAHRLEWIRIRWRYVSLPTYDIAREAALCMRH
jgi:hypothetical protein